MKGWNAFARTFLAVVLAAGVAALLAFQPASGETGTGSEGDSPEAPGMMGPQMGRGMGPGLGQGTMMDRGMGPGMMGPQMGYGMAPGMSHGMMTGPGMMGPHMRHGMVPGIGPAWIYGFPGHMGRTLSRDDVARILEHRLAWHGNKRLKLGAVNEKDDRTVAAEIVTLDGSLVQRLEVDRRSGRIWQID